MLNFFDCANGRCLAVVSREDVLAGILDTENKTISAALIFSGGPSISSRKVWEKIIDSLLFNRCRYFVCCGDFGEDIHDFIDGYWSLLLVKGADVPESIITTFHNHEDADDIVYFFTSMTDRSDELDLLVAVLDETPYELEIRNRLIGKELLFSGDRSLSGVAGG